VSSESENGCMHKGVGWRHTRAMKLGKDWQPTQRSKGKARVE
jgi:hypothetical protein